jgi:hypothetical protein
MPAAIPRLHEHFEASGRRGEGFAFPVVARRAHFDETKGAPAADSLIETLQIREATRGIDRAHQLLLRDRVSRRIRATFSIPHA